jgi:hypothetical protein
MRAIAIKAEHSFPWTTMRQLGELSMPSIASKRGQFSADYTIKMSGFDF